MQHFQEFLNKKVSFYHHGYKMLRRNLINEYFPLASTMMKQFHVVRYVTEALGNVRERIQKYTAALR